MEVKNSKPVKLKLHLFGLVLIVILGLASCKTTRVATQSAVRPISSGKLIRNMESSAFDYRHLSIKRISCQFDDGKSSRSFKASIQAEKDKRIVVMISKLNIPVGRLWLTPDSVKFVNFLEDNYYLGDYNYLSSLLGFDLDFETVHAVISNNIFMFRDEKQERDNREYEVKIDSGLYVMESVKKLKANSGRRKIDSSGKGKTRSGILTDSPVRQLIYVDPENFKLRKIRMEDAANQRNLSIDFAEYTPVDKQLYPGEINLRFRSPDNTLEMRIRLANFSTEAENEIRFKVPEKYTRINKL